MLRTCDLSIAILELSMQRFCRFVVFGVYYRDKHYNVWRRARVVPALRENAPFVEVKTQRSRAMKDSLRTDFFPGVRHGWWWQSIAPAGGAGPFHSISGAMVVRKRRDGLQKASQQPQCHCTGTAENICSWTGPALMLVSGSGQSQTRGGRGARALDASPPPPAGNWHQRAGPSALEVPEGNIFGYGRGKNSITDGGGPGSYLQIFRIDPHRGALQPET